MPRKLTWTPELIETGLINLGTSNSHSATVNEACLKALQLIRSAINSDRGVVEAAAKTRLKRAPYDATAQRIKQLEAMIHQYEPVAIEQEKLGFQTTRQKVSAWQKELEGLQAGMRG